MIGSQAAHASIFGELPDAAMRSVEVDIVIRGDRDGEMADLVDGSIGEASMYHETFCFYACISTIFISLSFYLFVVVVGVAFRPRNAIGSTRQSCTSIPVGFPLDAGKGIRRSDQVKFEQGC